MIVTAASNDSDRRRRSGDGRPPRRLPPDDPSGPATALVTSADLVCSPPRSGPRGTIQRLICAVADALTRGFPGRADRGALPPRRASRAPRRRGDRVTAGSLVPLEGGRARTLTERQVLGRAPTCDLVLDDVQASREHAVIWWEDECWHVRDLNSLNGTYVEGRRLHPSQTATLERGDRVSFGGSAETWVLGSDRPPAREPGGETERPDRG